jgi:hypothetical protein
MAMVIEVQIQSSSANQQQEIIDQITDIVSGTGFSIDASSYTPEAAVLSELANVATSRCTFKVYQA